MTEPNWRDFLSDPPRPHNLVEIMRTIILMAKEDAEAAEMDYEGTASARRQFQEKVGYDLYDEALALLDAPIFQAVDSEGEPTLPNEAQALSHVEPIATLRVPPEELKGLREGLCILQGYVPDSQRGWAHRARAVDRLIGEIDRHRPLGPDGKHGDLHTSTCGCDDRS